MTQEEKNQLNEMADSLYHVAGYITMVAKCDNTAVTKCDCRDCTMLGRVHKCMNTMEKMIEDSK